MHSKRTTEDYKKRILRVIDYIHAHLDEELDGETLAGIACFSPYHWHRIYHAMTGETVAQTIRRLRLHRASGELISSSDPIAQIAERAGYNSVEAFNRAFRKAFQLPPAAFRQSRNSHDLERRFIDRKLDMYKVEITTIEDMTLAAIHHKGSYMESGKAFNRLMVWAGPIGLINSSMRMIGIYHNDPNEVPEAELHSDAGIVVTGNVEIEDPVHLVKIPGGEYATLTHKGPYADLSNAYNWLFGHWLPQSGREAADQSCFEEYLNDARTTAPSDLLTLIYLPLKISS